MRMPCPVLGILAFGLAMSSSPAQDCTAVFAQAGSHSTPQSPSALALGDFDGDGSQDLAVGTRGPIGISIYRNEGRGVFAPRATEGGTAAAGALVAGDMDGDGDLDSYYFFRGPVPSAPFPACGLDSTVDTLGCTDDPACK